MIRPQSPQKDRFAHDRLPREKDWPEIVPLAGVPQSEPLNCAALLIDRHLEGPAASRVAVRSAGRAWTYAELGAHVGRIANVLKEDYGIEPGNRVLIRGANSPEVAAVWLAIQKIGAVAVATMSLLRAGELATLLDLSRPKLAVCDVEIAAELESALRQAHHSCALLTYGAESGALYEAVAEKPDSCDSCPTLGDDISIIAFTSGTTGKPKATVHFHRDIVAICETVCRHIIRPAPDDVLSAPHRLPSLSALADCWSFRFMQGPARS